MGEAIASAITDFVKKHWLEWESVPAVGVAIGAVYFFLCQIIKQWLELTLDATGRIALAIPFVLLLVVYLVWCGIHHRKEKEKGEKAEEDKTSKKMIWKVYGVCAAMVLVVVLILVAFAGNKQDGQYVIWAEEYHVALSPMVHNKYYLAGSKVSARGDKLTDYSQNCVLELDFNKDGTFTISYNGKFLGVTPGKNGVGYSDSCTSTLWELEEVNNGVYYIRNVQENTYLKWFEHMSNWTSHPNIVDDNEKQYQMRLDRVE